MPLGCSPSSPHRVITSGQMILGLPQNSVSPDFTAAIPASDLDFCVPTHLGLTRCTPLLRFLGCTCEARLGARDAMKQIPVRFFREEAIICAVSNATMTGVLYVRRAQKPRNKRQVAKQVLERASAADRDSTTWMATWQIGVS